MWKTHEFKFLLPIISVIFLLSGCVDTSVQNIPDSFNLVSQIKLVNLVATGGNATLTLSGEQFGSVAPGSETPAAGQPFREVPAGTKVLVFANSDTTLSDNFSTDTDYKMRVFIVGNNTSGYSIVKSLQRYIWQQKGTASGQALFPADTAQVTVFNASPGVVIDALAFRKVSDSTSTTVELGTPVAFGTGSPYIKLAAPTSTEYQVFVVQGTDTLSTISMTVGPQSRYTGVIYDVSTAIKNNVFIDD